MKKYVVGFMIVALLSMGATTQVGRSVRTDNYGWERGGETTTAYTSPAVNERDYANLIANHSDAIVFTLEPYRWNSITVRFIVDDDADDTVFDVFASKGQDYFTRICTLTLVGGTASAPSTSTGSAAVFVDTITITNEVWATDIKEVDAGGADRQSTVTWDMRGYDTYAFIGTTVDDTTLVQITGH